MTRTGAPPLGAPRQLSFERDVVQLHDAPPNAHATTPELVTALNRLRDGLVWRVMRVELDLTDSASLPHALVDPIFRIVQECLTHIARHARARYARVSVRVCFDRVWITVADDGVGFPYDGRFWLVDVLRRQFGPLSVRDRVAALGGDMVFSSNESGSQLDVALPLQAG
jgi:signal transduction histidine kinase